MNVITRNIDNISRVFILTCLLLTAALLQIKYDRIVHPHNTAFTTETKYIVPAKIVQNFSFGFKNSLADFYWLKAVQDFNIWDGTDPFYLEEYRNIATLDPTFAYPYLLGILTFTSSSANYKNSDGRVLESMEAVSLIGIKNLPDNWEIPFYLGTGFQITKNQEKALYYLKLAASHKNAPERIGNAYRTYLKNTLTGRTATGDLIKAIYETTESKTTKKILKESIILTDLTEILQGVVNNYKKKYGVYPSTIFDLAEKKMILSSVELNKEFKIIINQDTGKVFVTSRKANNQ